MIASLQRSSTNRRRLARRTVRTAAERVRLEQLEGRQLFALLNIDLQLPLVTTQGGSQSYNALTDAFDSSSVPSQFQLDANSDPIPIGKFGGNRLGTKSTDLHIFVDNSGGLLGGDPTLPDLMVVGSVTVNGTTYSGTLLTGEILPGGAFGFADDAAKFDFRFHTTGGLLADTYFQNKDIGLVMNVEDADGYSPYLPNEFNSSFGGVPKATIGPIDTITGNGPPAPVSLGDYVWADTNANGIQDASESGINGVTVDLLDSNGNPVLDLNNNPITTVTGPNPNQLTSDGYYQFSNLPPGTYQVKVDSVNSALIGYVPTIAHAPTATTANDSSTGTETSALLTSGQSDETLDFGFYKKVTVGDYIWNDANANGIQDGNEIGINNVSLTLTGTDGAGNTITDHATTDVNGTYLFTEAPGTYTVTVDAANFTAGGALATFLASPTFQGGNPANDSNSTPSATTPATLAGGSSDLTIDVGYFQKVTIGDFVWNDANANGIQDAGEAGIPGVNLTLTGTNGAGQSVTDQATTDAAGLYHFTEAPGTYTVTVDAANTALIGYTSTVTGNGTAATDSNPNPSGTTPTTLPGGASDLTIDFGYYLPVTIGDFVWNDANANGVQDSGETGIAGVTLTLTGTNGAGVAVTDTTTTDSTGHYLFTEVPGTYTVAVTNPAGYIPTVTGKGTTATDSNVTPTGTTPGTLAGGSSDLTLDFGFYKNVTIGDFVWFDTNANGVQDAGEAGIAGVTLTLTGTNGAGVAVTGTTTTDSTGHYLFTEAPGTYTVAVTNPAGYTATSTGKGITSTDSNPTPSGTTPGTLSGGASDLTIDFGYYKPVTIGDFVWNDANANGVQDSGETGLAGVTLTLTGTNGAGATVTDHATTNSTGHYLFTEAPGTYTVTVDAANFNGGGALVSYVASATVQGSNRAVDSNANPSGTTPGTLSGGSSDLSIDFGYYRKTGSISGTKFLDVTGNGFSHDDTGLRGVTIQLYLDKNNSGTYNSGDTLYASTTTASDGSYSFSNLPAGHYLVKEVVPSGYVRTGPTLSDTYAVTVAAGDAKAGYDFDNAETCDLSDFCNVYYIINGCTKVTDLRGHTHQGDTVTAYFTYKGSENNHPVTLVSYDAPTSSFDANNAYLQQIYQSKTILAQTNRSYSITVVIPDCYYQVDFVCGFAIDTLGPANSNIFYTPQNRLISADNGGTSACFCGSSTISGSVFADSNNDGDVDANESGIKNVIVTLTGTNDLGQAVYATDTTDSDGFYQFTGLRDGKYTVTESQPSAYKDGKDALGTVDGDADGTLGNDVFSNVVIAGGNQTGINYNFGEIANAPTGCSLTCNMTATIGFWQNRNGQSLIKCLNGSSNSTKLGNWLASTFPNLFGNTNGCAASLAGKSNTSVAAAFITLFNARGTKIEAQIMATALSVYVTDSDLAGTTARSYGFTVNSSGTGAATFNVGSDGSAIGLTNNRSYTIAQILAAANSSDILDGSSSRQTAAADLFDNINNKGDI